MGMKIDKSSSWEGWSEMKQLLSVVLSLGILCGQIAQATPLCARVHGSGPFTKRMLISSAEDPLASSEMTITGKDFSAGTKENLSELIYLAAQTSLPEVSKKQIEDKGLLSLAMPLENDYYLRLTYKKNSRNAKLYRLQEAFLETPSDRQVPLTEKILSLHSPEIRENNMFQLDDIYPTGKKIQAEVPVTITGESLDQFLNILPRLKYLTKPELRKFTEGQDISRLKLLAHGRFFKEFLTKYMPKFFFRQAAYAAVSWALFSGMSSSGPGVLKSPETHPMPPATQQWVLDMNLSLGMTIGKEAKQEIVQLNQEIQNRLKDKSKTPKVALDLSQPKLTLGEGNYAWVIEKRDTNQTFITFSRDNAEGTLEYVAIEINPQAYPQTIAALKKSGMQMTLK
jgi:hypothetical protein